MKLYELKLLKCETLKVTYSVKAFYLNMLTPGINSLSYFSHIPHIFNTFEETAQNFPDLDSIQS